MTLDKRVERNTQSVIALQELLRDVISNPTSYTNHSSLRDSLTSQGSLAKFNDESKCIFASSINTIKRIAEASLNGGFDSLNRLRIGAQESLAKEESKKTRSNKVDKIGLVKRVNELEDENQSLRQDLLLLTLAFDKSLAQSKIYAQKTDISAVAALCKREQRELLDMLSLRQHPITTNVTKIRG